MNLGILKERSNGSEVDSSTADLTVAKRGMKNNRSGWHSFRTRGLSVVETLVFKIAPRSVGEQLVAGLREYNAFEESAQAKEEIERQIAAEQQVALRRARAQRAKLLESPGVVSKNTSNGHEVAAANIRISQGSKVKRRVQAAQSTATYIPQ